MRDAQWTLRGLLEAKVSSLTLVLKEGFPAGVDSRRRDDHSSVR